MKKNDIKKSVPKRRADIEFWFDMRTGRYLATVANRMGIDELLKASMYLYALALELNQKMTIGEGTSFN